MIEKNTKKVSSSFQENIEYMNQVLPVQESFDVIQRDMLIGGKKASFYFIDGFTKDETMLKIMTSFFGCLLYTSMGDACWISARRRRRSCRLLPKQ